jgi:hypothetical protein
LAVAKKGSEIMQVRLRMRRDQHRELEREAKRRGQTINAEALRRLFDRDADILLEMLQDESARQLLTGICRMLARSGDWTTNSPVRRVFRLATALGIEACANKGKVSGEFPPEIALEKLSPDDRGIAQILAIHGFVPRDEVFKTVKEEDTQ